MSKRREHVPKRGDIFVVTFDPTIGSEIKKTRPALILQNDIANEYSSTTIVAAITSHDPQDKRYPVEVFISAGEGGLDHDSLILCNQIRTIDKVRLAKKLGKVTVETMNEVDTAIEISLGMIEI